MRQARCALHLAIAPMHTVLVGCSLCWHGCTDSSCPPNALVGGPAFSLPAVLARQPPHVPALRFMNFEGQPEAGDLTNRIEQVGPEFLQASCRCCCMHMIKPDANPSAGALAVLPPPGPPGTQHSDLVFFLSLAR